MVFYGYNPVEIEEKEEERGKYAKNVLFCIFVHNSVLLGELDGI